MKQLLGEFKTFILRGNVIELAVAVVIGLAFKELVDAAVRLLVAPILSAALASGKTGTWYLDFKYLQLGSFLIAVLNFIITAAVVFFLFVKPLNKLVTLLSPKKDTVDLPPATLNDVVAELKAVKEELRRARGENTPPPPIV